MTTRSVLVVALIMIINSSYAQDKPKKVYRPDIPGSFLIDFGFNSGFSKPTNFNTGFWGSRTLNLYYHYPVRLAQSKFTFNPGGGFSFERFKFTNGYTLFPQPGTSGLYILDNPASPSVGGSISLLQNTSIRKSMLVANYFDLMPIEFRFDSNPKDLSRSFNVSIGARVGALIESHTKIKYSGNGVTGTLKDKQQHGLNPFRYGVYSRIGIGNFNWFMFYNLSPYFASGKGPNNSNIGSDITTTNMNTMTIGISLNGF